LSLPGIAARCVLFGTLFASVALCQQREIVIKAVNGKTGKPIVNQRLVIWGGKSEQDALHKVQNLDDLTTRADGTAVLKIDSDNTGWIQVWADRLTLCQDNPNSRAFSVEKVMRTGESSPNNCGSAPLTNIAGTFIVFARQPTLREKLAW
jgi:hypothetical protein